ncbi:MAG: 30S ribosomal protein S20 [Veillonellaceae bacterium]|nr:30S ribosomal protein S20 [Veillonellaceae bacterium]
MPQIKANIKSMKQDAERRAQNTATKSRIRTATKRTIEAIESGDHDAAKAAYANATRIIDKAASKGVIHKNNAARKKSALHARLKANDAE